jgi:hypothetical protein
VNWELIVDLSSILLSDKLSFLAFFFAYFNLEFSGDLSSYWVIKSVQELTHNSESFGDNSTNFTRVITCLSCFNSQINNADSSK